MENANATLFYHSKNSLYHYTILFYNTSTSQNSIPTKIFFFNLSLLLLSNRHFFPDSNGSTITNHHTTTTTPHHTTPHFHLYGSTIINHHTTTSTAPPSSITTPPPPKCFSLTASASHHTHYTIRKPKPISTGKQPLMNTEELMNLDTADQPRSQQEKKKKKPRSTPIKTQTTAARSMFPPSLINPDQPPKSHRNKNPDTADQPRSQKKKKKKKPYQP